MSNKKCVNLGPFVSILDSLEQHREKPTAKECRNCAYNPAIIYIVDNTGPFAIANTMTTFLYKSGTTLAIKILAASDKE
ncbi:MAG: hypothetical protein JAY74_18030 [Candidatus Thiodiazotropha taylori]|nr:hypothetical protein [Candidatus Thiodiazotropha taylori]RLW61040.1 MAG: hypothetical protein B6D75_03975 [gamma proteobacterium symbiont of Stewartia floridana]RLW63221.1 MAG: hypothetical protein B6D73_16270 [gamma proteobacterium symbiont of Stewartia floridana]